MEKQYTYEELEKMVKKFFANKEQLGFNCSCSFSQEVDQEQPHLFFSVENIENKFKKAVEKLMYEISQAATYFFFSQMNARNYILSPDEYDEEENKCVLIVKKNLQNTLNILFTNGLEKFVGIVLSFSQMVKLQYELKTISLSTDGKWHISPDYFWADGVWSNGQKVYADSSCSSLGCILQ